MSLNIHWVCILWTHTFSWESILRVIQDISYKETTKLPGPLEEADSQPSGRRSSDVYHSIIIDDYRVRERGAGSYVEAYAMMQYSDTNKCRDLGIVAQAPAYETRWIKLLLLLRSRDYLGNHWTSWCEIRNEMKSKINLKIR